VVFGKHELQPVRQFVRGDVQLLGLVLGGGRQRPEEQD
jgi:hypothetical protein